MYFMHEKGLLSVIFTDLLFLSNCNGLDIQTALENELFESINIEGGEILRSLDPTDASKASISMFYDMDRNQSSYQHKKLSPFQIDFVLVSEEKNVGDDFTIGLSILFIEFLSPVQESYIEIKMKNLYHDGNFTKEDSLYPEIKLPVDNFDERSIITSFGKQDAPTSNIKRIDLTVLLNEWDQRNQLYFTVTSYKIAKRGSNVKNCEHYSYHPDWWNCNTNEDTSQVLCVNYELTCNGLPNCAKNILPNPDENCEYHVGMQEALRLIVYCLLTVFVILLLAGCSKCCINRGLCLSRFRRDRRHSDLLDIIADTEEVSERPDGSPPTYDDAMKYVNDAFAEEDIEPPPLYSPTPNADEQSWPSGFQTNTSEDNNPDIPSTPPPYSI